MSKRKSKEPSILNSIDGNLSEQYKEIIGDIEEIQYQIQKADRRKAKKAKRKMKKGKIGFYETRSSKARIHAARRITSDQIIGTVISIFQDLKPLAILLARLVAAIICAILSLDIVKRNISSSVLQKMKMLYDACMGIVPAN